MRFYSKAAKVFIFFLIGLKSLYSQVDDISLMDVTSPSPTAYELGKFGSDMPNMYTGSATVNIPLHTISFDGWNLPLSLSYDTSGIRANQDASEVGLGWVLNATGVITRIVKTNNDLNLIESTTPLNNASPGYVFEQYSPLQFFNDFQNNGANGTTAEPLYQYGGLDTKKFDGEPDDFSYNFFGFSGGFVFGQIENGEIPIRQKQENGVIITFNQQNFSFTILTPTGFEGVFNIKERSTNFGGHSSSGGMFDDSNVDLLAIQNRGNFRVTTAWYLSKITSPTGKEMFFNYNIEENESSSFVSLSSPAFGEFLGSGNGVSFSRTAQEHVYLETIIVPNELQVTFNMEDREDIIKNFMFADENNVNEFPVEIQKPKRYTHINVVGLNQESSLLKNIVLQQSYFNQEFLHYHSTPDYNEESNKYQMLRSRLDHVLINDQKYSFEYNYGENGLVGKSTKAIDHFGYYNGKDDNWTLWPIKEFNPGFASNSDIIGFSNGTIADASNSSTDFYKFLTQPVKQVYFQDSSRKPNINFAVAGSLHKIIYPTNGSTTYNYDAIEYYTPGLTDPVNLPEFNGFPYSNNVGAEAVSFYSDTMGIPHLNINSGTIEAGGLRIKSIINKDEENNLVSKTTYDYIFPDGQTTGKLLTPLIICNGSLGTTSSGNTIYHFWFKNNNYLSASITAQGRRVGYNRVIEKREDFSGNSINTVYEFYNEPINKNDLLNFNQHTNHNHKNGRLIAKKSFKEGNLDYPVAKEEIQDYDSEIDMINSVIYSSSTGVTDYAHQVLSKTPIIKPITKQTISTTYLFATQNSYIPNGEVVEASTLNFNDNSQVRLAESTISDGSIIKKVTKRITDYQDEGIMSTEGTNLYQEFMNRNLNDKVLEEITYKDNNIVRALGYKYDIEHGNVVLREILSYEKGNGNFITSTNGFEFNGGYTTRVILEDYNNEGKLLQQRLENGSPVSFIWGYNNNYPVVKGENILYQDLQTAYNASQGVAFENALRSHSLTSNALITTFKYDPLVGVIKTIDPKGLEVNYNYNLLNRLINIKDEDQNILQEYEYNYGEIEKSGGLEINDLSFGIVSPYSSVTKSLKIKNNGNYDITVFGVSLPQYFTSPWENHSFSLRPGEEFDFPVIFNAPLNSITINSTATILSNQLNGTTEYVNLHAEVIQNGIHDLKITEGCSNPSQTNFYFNYGFQNKIITLDNTNGTAPIFIDHISNWDNPADECVSTNWENQKRKWVEDSNGNLVQVFDWEQSIVPAGECRNFTVQLTCSISYGYGDNWDLSTDITVFTKVLNQNGGFDFGPSYTINFGFESSENDSSSNDDGNNSNSPNFTTTGTTTATCSSGMSGNITITSGSVKVFNYPNSISGQGGNGATISLSGGGNGYSITPNNQVILTPSSYPTTYSFSSGTYNCNGGYGNSQIQVTQF